MKSTKVVYPLLSILVTVLVINFLLTQFTNHYAFKKNMINQRVQLMHLIAKAATTKDTSLTNKYSDSCLIYFSNLPIKERDSLRSYFLFIISAADSLDKDVLNTVKDNGNIDTTNMFSPTSKVILLEMCKRMDMKYSDLVKGLYMETTRVQKKLNKINYTGNIKRNADRIRLQIITTDKKRDSVYRAIYNRMFVLKK